MRVRFIYNSYGTNIKLALGPFFIHFLNNFIRMCQTGLVYFGTKIKILVYMEILKAIFFFQRSVPIWELFYSNFIKISF